MKTAREAPLMRTQGQRISIGLKTLKKYKDQKIVVIYSYDSKYFWKIAKIITLLSKKSSMYRTRKYFIINKTKPNGFPNSLA